MVVDAVAEHGDLREDEPAFGFGNRAAQFLRRGNPFLDDGVRVFERGLLGRTIGGATGQFRHFGDERIVLCAPIDDDFVFGHNFSSESLYFKTMLRTCFT